MAVLDDAASIKRLKAVFQEHLDQHDADIGLTPYADDGISAAPNQLYTTPAPAPVGPPAQAYAEGGSIIRKLLADVLPPRSRVMEPGIRSQYRDLHAPDNDNLSRQQWQSIRDWADSRRNDPEFRGIVDSVSHQNEVDEQWRRGLAAPQIVPGYADGGEVSPYTRFTEDGDRTADAWARYAPKGEYQSYDYLPRFSDPTDLARGVVDAAKGIGRDFADSGYNPARYLIHGADRFGQNYLSGITPQDVADMAVPHDLGDQYGLSGRVADALSTVMPGVGSLAIPPLYEGARYVADKYLPKFGEGGRVDKVIKTIRNTYGRYQGNRAAEAADLTNLDRISTSGLLDIFNPKNTGLLAALPPSRFEEFANPINPDVAKMAPYPRWTNVPGGGRVKTDQRTLDNYLSRLSGNLQEKGAYDAPTLWLGRTIDDLTNVAEHEGRHRMRAMDRLGDKASLVRLQPGNPGFLGKDADDNTTRMFEKYFPLEDREPIQPQYNGGPDRPPVSLGVQPFGEGGKVLSQVIREIAGKPSSIKIAAEGAVGAYPIREFEDVAKKFSSRHGNDYPINAYPKFDEDKARRIAEAYDAMKHDPTDPRVKRSYDALVDETMDQYRALKDTGADFSFLKPGEADPYAKTPSLGYLDLVRNGRLKVFPTEQGYGTQTDISDNPLLKRVGRVGDLDNATANDAFRVVHDALGHFGPGNPFFRAPGEERAWYAHSHSYSPAALPAATSELRGQNSWVNYGPHGEANRSAAGADTVYADQKAGLLPEWAYKYREGGVVNKLARKFLVDPVRERFPGIYQDPDKLVTQAKERFVPDLGKEGPMYSLFGHTRDSLDELSQGKRAAEADAPWREPPYNLSGTARTSPRILTRPNANRLVDTIGAGLEDPAIRGTRSWYEMSPMWERMKQLGASDDEMRNLNNRMSVMSAGSDPKTEINRGFYANWLANNGRLEDFVKYGGVPDEGRGDWFPRDMMGLQGHAYHGTAQVPNLLDNEFTGRLWGKEHKVPTYAAATDPLRPYSDRPIADSHFSRILGYPDVSTAATDAERKGVMSGTQYSDMVPWFQKNVANRLDMRPRDAQALLWNLGGPQTGVRYIGPSKLEMISNHMDNVAKELGISPDMARDKLLKGEIGGSTAFDAPFKRGGVVEDFANEFQAMNYRKGGPARDPDDVLNYHPLFFRHGGKYKAP